MHRLTTDIAREEALKKDAARAIAQLDEERATIGQRLEDAETHSARIAAELSKTETVSRDAQAALAELLARQAAMRAERRVAEAAFEAAKSQLARTEQERLRLAEQQSALGDGGEQQNASRCRRSEGEVGSASSC